MMDDKKRWYNVELQERQAELFKAYLRCQEIYFEPSSAGNLVHFQCLMDADEKYFTNLFLRSLMGNAQ